MARLFSIIFFLNMSFLLEAQSDLSNLAYQNYLEEKYEEAIRLETEALKIYANTVGHEHQNYARSLSNLANYNAAFCNYIEAIKLQTEAMKITEKALGKEHPDYMTSLNYLASYNSEIGYYSKAKRLGNKALEITEKVLGRENFYYATSLNKLAFYNSKLGNHLEAIRLENEALNIIGKISGHENHYYISALNKLAFYNSELANYAVAIKLEKEALKIQEKIIGSKHPDYATSLNNLAVYNARLGNYVDAIKLTTEALEITEEKFGHEHPDYAASLSNLADYNSEIGNFAEAIRLELEALEIREKTLGHEHPNFATSLNKLATYSAELGNYTLAIKLGKDALNIRGKLLGHGHPDYATSLSNLAAYNSELGNFAEAISLEKEALKIRGEKLGREHPDYALSLNNLAGYNSELGDNQEAIRLEEEALKIIERTLGCKHPHYAISLSCLADFNSNIGNQEKLLEIIKKLFPFEINNLIYYFKYLSKAERLSYWEKHKSLFEFNLPLYAWKYPSKNMNINLLNGLLISKGILLNSEIEFDQFLSKSESTDLKNKYENIKLIKIKLNKLYEKPIKQRLIDTDSLERRANELERQLMWESAEFGDYTRALSISWEKVRENLKEKEAAIEFVKFPISNDSILYMACIIKPNINAPTLVNLFEEKDLSSLNEDELYSKTIGSNLVWGKLQSELDGVNNVYFAPDGVLHQIGIEYFPDFEESERHIYDRFNLYRLSSTRQLALKKTHKSSKNAIIYGGILYNTDSITMVSESRKYDLSTSRKVYLEYHVADSLSLRSGIKYLPFTLTEATLVKDLLKNASQHSLLVTGNEATEESFKSLSGSNKSILHIATHGFYWKKVEAERRAQANERLQFMSQFGKNTRRNVEDKALTRTGLFMAGANNSLSGKGIPDDIDDGILTALEIANLDLRSLDLVVLSACQTGIGDISGDGVFGLQRGFKKAGANSILMSLWDVDDEATQILMVNFYKNYLNGMSKRESLLTAQKAVRETPGFEDPEYWAAFILLDALN